MRWSRPACRQANVPGLLTWHTPDPRTPQPSQCVVAAPLPLKPPAEGLSLHRTALVAATPSNRGGLAQALRDDPTQLAALLLASGNDILTALTGAATPIPTTAARTDDLLPGILPSPSGPQIEAASDYLAGHGTINHDQNAAHFSPA